MIDLHCHLLPGVDDGPESLDDALALARAAAAAGNHTIAATPHVDHRWGVAPLSLRAELDALRAALADAGIAVNALPGAELGLPRYTELDDRERDAIRLGDGPYLLIESPHNLAAGDFHSFVGALLERGEAIILAHPERCPSFLRNPGRVAALVEQGVLCSITASSLDGRFGGNVRDFALQMLREGLVHNVASDSHDAIRRGPELLPGLHAAEREIPGILGLCDWLTIDVPASVLAGAPLPRRPPVRTQVRVAPRGLRRLLGR